MIAETITVWWFVGCSLAFQHHPCEDLIVEHTSKEACLTTLEDIKEEGGMVAFCLSKEVNMKETI